jgi:hypothetical protein
MRAKRIAITIRFGVTVSEWKVFTGAQLKRNYSRLKTFPPTARMRAVANGIGGGGWGVGVGARRGGAAVSRVQIWRWQLHRVGGSGREGVGQAATDRDSTRPAEKRLKAQKIQNPQPLFRTCGISHESCGNFQVSTRFTV